MILKQQAKHGFWLLMTLATSTIGHPAEIHAIITGALTGAMRNLQPAYEKASGNQLIISWGPSSGDTKDAIPQRLKNGETPDVLIMVAPAYEKLVAEGKFVASSRIDIARSPIGVGVREGSPKPDVSTVSALRTALLSAKSIGYSEGASGVYISSQLISKLGISDQISSKMKKITGELVGEAIARGELEIGLQQVSELKAVKGVSFLGPLPEEVQFASVISCAIAQSAREPQAAKSLMDFLSSKETAASFAKSGLDPVEHK
jgi:molybdate transport system substrate-binding protein